MGDMKKIKRIAAGIMSAALVFGFAGSIKPPAVPVIAAETEEEGNDYIRITYNSNTKMYEYEFIDAYIYNIHADPYFVNMLSVIFFLQLAFIIILQKRVAIKPP